MNLQELAKLAAAWRELNASDKWPRSWPMSRRTLREMDRCKIAAFDFDRHCRDNFMEAMSALRAQVGTLWDLGKRAESLALQTHVDKLEKLK